MKSLYNNFLIKLFFVFFILFSCTNLFSQNFKIKVLLNEYDTKKKKVFNISSNKFISKKTKSKNYRFKKPKFQILVKNNIIYARNNKKPFRKVRGDQLFITSPSKHTIVNKQDYKGTVSFILDRKIKKLYVINKLSLDDYIYSVLLSEGYQTWPLEMQKVQAIVSRTYAVWQMLDRRRRHPKERRLYDIKCNNFHQRYDGHHSYHHLQEAVTQTKNLIITHNDEVALAMFDACCGGCIPAHTSIVDFSKAPYLARKTACTHCQNYCLYSWRRKIPVKKFLDYLYDYEPIKSKLLEKNRKKLLEVKVNKKDRAGVSKNIFLKQEKKRHAIIDSKDIWMSMRNIIRSQCFSINKVQNNIIINGRGFGHHIGLCQRGAREMVRKKIFATKNFRFLLSWNKTCTTNICARDLIAHNLKTN